MEVLWDERPAEATSQPPLEWGFRAAVHRLHDPQKNEGQIPNPAAPSRSPN